MLRAGFTNFDVENCGGSDLLDPRILAEPLDPQNDSLVQTLSLNLNAVPDPAHVLEADRASPQSHDQKGYQIRLLFA